ncbi:MAG TPA: ATP-binding protein [Terriglobales bacterium]|jgi:PAS domain S-box-containing protein|nr:ATP-binding protein [Terriglobales bacterium]
MNRSKATRPEFVAARQFRKKTSALRILRRAVDHCQELVFLTDAEGILQYVNPSCEAVTGYSAGQLIDKNLTWIAPEVSQGETWDSIRRQALEKGAFRGVTGLRCKHGEVVELDIAVTAVRDPRSQAASLAWTGTVVARQQEIKDDAESSPKMESLGAFAGGITHDFNNLLMVMGSYAEMALACVPAENPARRHLQEILAGVRRASDLTRRLLAFGRKQVTGKQLCSLNWIVEDAVGMLSRLVEEDIEIRVSLGKDVSLVRVDRGQVEQLLLNLVVNARDAMPNGGELVIQTENLTLDDHFAADHAGIVAGEHVMLTIADSGHGMNPDQMSRIFDPFYTTKPEGKGTGLGLAIVRSIVQESCGVITAESEPAAGTTFKIFLPVAGAMGEKKPAASLLPELPLPRGSETLLVVEDALPLRQATVEYLRSLGYEVQSAANGVEALDYLQNQGRKIALVLADVVTPRMSGPEFAEAVHASRSSAKILFMSGHPEEMVRRKGLDNLDENFLQKPFSLRSLAVKIREVLGQPARAHAAAAGV